MEQEFNIDPKLIDELAKSIKSEKDLAALSKHLLKLTVELLCILFLIHYVLSLL